MSCKSDIFNTYLFIFELVSVKSKSAKIQITGRILRLIAIFYSNRGLYRERIADTHVNEHTYNVIVEGAAGKVSGAFVYAYPPGIPVLAPGEVVDRQAVNGIKSMIDSGLNVAGVNDGYIKVLCGE